MLVIRPRGGYPPATFPTGVCSRWKDGSCKLMAGERILVRVLRTRVQLPCLLSSAEVLPEASYIDPGGRNHRH